MHEDDVQRAVADHLVGDRVAADALDVADRVHPAPRVDRRAAVEVGVLAQDPALELAHPRRGLEPQLLRQRGAVLAVAGQRVGLPARPIEREHQLAAQALAQRMAAREPLELPDELVVAPEREVGIDAVLERDAVTLLQMRALDERERLGELRQRRTPPERERRAQPRRRRRRVARVQRGAPLGAQALEAHEVQRLRRQRERIARRARPQRPGGQRLAQPRHVDVDHLHGRLRDVLAPQVVHQALHRHRAVGVQRQPRQQRARLAPAESQRRVRVDDLERAQHAEVHGVSGQRYSDCQAFTADLPAIGAGTLHCARP